MTIKIWIDFFTPSCIFFLSFHEENQNKKVIVSHVHVVWVYVHVVPVVGKVTLKSNGDEAFNNEFLLKSNGDEALNDGFP